MTRTRTAASARRRSACAIACTLDLVGDKWSLLVIRDLLHGKRTFKELADSPERIPTNILADRLKRLEEAGVIVRAPYQERPVRHAYSLSEKGTAFRDVLGAFIRWGKAHVTGTVTLNDPAPDMTPAAWPIVPMRTGRRRRGLPRPPTD